MSIDLAIKYVETFRKAVVGEPRWVAQKQVFEFADESVQVVVALKLVRVAHGLGALDLLCKKGLFIDFGATLRCIYESVFEIYFLLEERREPSGNVTRFIDEFFSRTIDGHLTSEHHTVPTKKILAAASRYMSHAPEVKSEVDVRAIHDRIYKTFCGYTHASYSHIMEVYGPMGPRASFNCGGVPSVEQKRWRHEYVGLATNSCLLTTAFAALEFGRKDLFDEITENC